MELGAQQADAVKMNCESDSHAQARCMLGVLHAVSAGARLVRGHRHTCISKMLFKSLRDGANSQGGDNTFVVRRKWIETRGN